MEESSQLMPSPLTPPRVVSQSRTERGVASECARHGEGGRGHPGRGRIKCGGGGGNPLCGREESTSGNPEWSSKRNLPKRRSQPPTRTGPVALRIAIALRRGEGTCPWKWEVGGEKKRSASGVWSGDKGREGTNHGKQKQRSVAWKGETCSVFPFPPNPSGFTKTCDITDFVASSSPSLRFPASSSSSGRRRRRRRRPHRFHLYFRIDIFHSLRVNLPNNASHRSLRIYAAFASPAVPPLSPSPSPSPASPSPITSGTNHEHVAPVSPNNNHHSA